MDPALENAARKLEECLGAGQFSRVGEDMFFAKRGSSVIGIHLQLGRGGPQVLVQAAVVTGADLTSFPELLRSLLEHNAESRWGHFALDRSGRILFQHLFSAASLTREDLIPCIGEIARVADEWDDVIVEEAGGERALDRLHKPGDPAA